MKRIWFYLVLVGLALTWWLSTSPQAFDTIGDWGTAIARPIFVPLIVLFNQQAFIYILSALILIAALVAGYSYRRQIYLPRLQRFQRLENAVKSLPVPKATGENDLPHALNALETTFLSHKLFVMAFEQWQDDLRRRGRFPAAAFSDYADRMREARGELREGASYAALPSAFTSFGLILTFLGLVAALYFAARGFRSGNYDEAKAAITLLLNASAFKFLTSVAALIGAFLLTLLYQFCEGRIEAHRIELLAKIDHWLGLWRADAQKNAAHDNTKHAALQNGISESRQLVATLDRLNETISTMAAPLPTSSAQ